LGHNLRIHTLRDSFRQIVRHCKPSLDVDVI
jgi:hypothetical protein